MAASVRQFVARSLGSSPFLTILLVLLAPPLSMLSFWMFDPPPLYVPPLVAIAMNVLVAHTAGLTRGVRMLLHAMPWLIVGIIEAPLALILYAITHSAAC